MMLDFGDIATVYPNLSGFEQARDLLQEDSVIVSGGNAYRLHHNIPPTSAREKGCPRQIDIVIEGDIL